MRLYVFRHGQTDWNASGRIQGHLDIPLNDTGRAQARALIAPLRSLGIQAILSSDLSRAWETAELIAGPLGIAVTRDERLREVHLGKLQGLDREEIQKLYGKDFSAQIGRKPISDADIVNLGAESGEQVVGRIRGAVSAFAAANPELDRIGVATHGGVIRRMIQLAPASWGFPPPIANGVVYPFDAEAPDYTGQPAGWVPFSR